MCCSVFLLIDTQHIRCPCRLCILLIRDTQTLRPQATRQIPGIHLAHRKYSRKWYFVFRSRSAADLTCTVKAHAPAFSILLANSTVSLGELKRRILALTGTERFLLRVLDDKRCQGIDGSQGEGQQLTTWRRSIARPRETKKRRNCCWRNPPFSKYLGAQEASFGADKHGMFLCQESYQIHGRYRGIDRSSMDRTAPNSGTKHGAAQHQDAYAAGETCLVMCSKCCVSTRLLAAQGTRTHCIASVRCKRISVKTNMCTILDGNVKNVGVLKWTHTRALYLRTS